MARGLLRAAGVIGLCGLRLGLLLTLLLGLTAARGNPVAMALAAGAAPGYVLLERPRPLVYVAAARAIAVAAWAVHRHPRGATVRSPA